MRLITASLLILVCLSWQDLSAQRSRFKPLKHEIGLDPVGITLTPAFSEYYDGLPFGSHLGHGLRYKYFLTLNDGIRAGFFRQQTSLIDVDLFGTRTSAQRTNNRLQLGYERNLVRGASRLFVGIDGVLSLGKVEGQVISNLVDPLPISENYRSWGANVFAGYRVFFNSRFSATIEGGAYFMNHSYDANLGADEGSPILYPLSEFGGQLSFYLNYHFGGKIKKRCTCPRH